MGFLLEDKLSITQVMHLKKRLQNELEQSDNILIDGNKVSRVDASGLQLLLTARNVCHNQSINWQWQGASSELVGAAKALGLIKSLGLSDFC
ncbi:STAS domain-containing protein [Candidatus Enterovibrio escicola]|uniref:STAS domain-containing protein n=1 Tax=Candidatus Enterovibrio escicola TaxID=1927127 RepID=UPI001237E45A|nr:STAS domain-containing protein [Candidatus Enterovibrio escacola]